MVAIGKAQLFQAADACRFISPKTMGMINESFTIPSDHVWFVSETFELPTLAAKVTSIPWNAMSFNCPPCKYHDHFLLMEHDFLEMSCLQVIKGCLIFSKNEMPSMWRTTPSCSTALHQEGATFHMALPCGQHQWSVAPILATQKPPTAGNVAFNKRKG